MSRLKKAGEVAAPLAAGFAALLLVVVFPLYVIARVGAFAYAAEEAITINVDATVAPPAFTAELVEAEDASLAAATQKLNTMSLGEQRKLGITFRNVRRVTKELHREGVLTRGDRRGNAALVMARIIEENPQAYEECRASYGDTEDGDKDWSAFFEALIAFLEKLIPLFMMFGGLS